MKPEPFMSFLDGKLVVSRVVSGLPSSRRYRRSAASIERFWTPVNWWAICVDR